MPTTSKPKVKKALLCARPDETVEFEFMGAVFDIGMLPRRLYLKYTALILRVNESLDVVRGPDEKEKDFYARLGEESTKMIMSPEYLDEFIELQDEIVRFGVKGHKNLCYQDDKETPIPFETKTVIEAGRECEVVDDYTMRVYDTVDATTAISNFMVKGARGADETKKKRQRKK